MMCYDTSLEDLKRKKSQKPTWRPWSFWPRGTEQLENLSRLHCIWIPSTIGVLSRGQEKIEANQSLPPYTPLLFTAIYRGHLHQIDWHFWLLEAPCILPLKIGSCSANWESNRILLHCYTDSWNSNFKRSLELAVQDRPSLSIVAEFIHCSS